MSETPRVQVTPRELAHAYLYRAACEGRHVMVGSTKQIPAKLLSRFGSVKYDLSRKVGREWANRKAIDIKKTLGLLFDSLRPYVKDYDRFIKEVRVFLYEFPSLAGKWQTEVTNIEYGYARAYGNKQIGGYRPGDPPWGRGMDPPEYEEVEIDFPETVHANIVSSFDLRYLQVHLEDYVHSLVTDPRKFRIAAREVFENRKAVNLFFKMVADGISSSIQIPDDMQDTVNDEVRDAVTNEAPDGYDVSWSIKSIKRSGKPLVKPSPQEFHLSVPVVVEINVDEATIDPDRYDYEYEYDRD